jgi:hypothetical protein
MALATAGVLSGCGAEPGQDGVDSSEHSVLYGTELTTSRTSLSPTISGSLVVRPPKGELIGRDDPKGREQFNPLDANLAALVRATLKCKGSVDPDDFDGSSGYLKPRFEKCEQDDKSFQHIQNLLGIQNVDARAARHFAYTWESARKAFPRDEIKVCPTWKHLESINPPTFENIKQLPPGAVGEEFNRFEVRSEICKDTRCTVKHALACVAGAGSQFVVEPDYEKGIILTDPVWWLDDTDFPDPSNPFLSPGYYHAMSFYGAVPGSVYGAVNREGEYCSKYFYGYHYKLLLRPVHCAPDWVCMTECR